MEVTTFERILAIIIPVLIALAGTTLPAYFNNKRKKDQEKKTLAEADKTDAEADSIQINSMQSILEATNKMFITPLKQRVEELEKENGELRQKISDIREEYDKLLEESTADKLETKKMRMDMLHALLELDNCKKDLQTRLKALEEKANGGSNQ